MITFPLATLLLTATLVEDSATEDPAAAVRAAVLGYAEAVYEAKPELIDRVVEPSLSKLGLVRNDHGPRDVPMSFERLRELCEGGYKSEPARRHVEVLGVLDHVATAKLSADWGVDYLQLGLHDGAWKIRHVLWQTHPHVPDSLESPVAIVMRTMQTRDEDRAAIEQACNAYIDAFYEVEPERLDGAVATDLVKYGYFRQESLNRVLPMPMNLAQLRQLAGHAYADGKPAEDAPRQVEILDQLDYTAAVRVTADWGIDFMNLAKRDGEWRIFQVIWQSHPPVKLSMSQAVNETCPFSGDPIRADSLTSYEGKVVGFCNPHCRDKFARDPKRYLAMYPELGK